MPPDAYCANFSAISNCIQETFVNFSENNETNSLEFFAYPIVVSISNIFLVFAFIAFSIVSDLHDTLFSKSTIAFTVGHFAAYICVAINGFGAKTFIQTEIECKVLAFLTQFFFLNAYSWITVLAFQLFQTYRVFRPKHGSDPKFPPKDRKKLAWYFMYATGIPFIVTVITAILEFDLAGKDHLLKPDFGVKSCYFHPDKYLSSLVLLHMPILLMQIANAVFYGITIYKLNKSWKETGMLRVHRSSTKIYCSNSYYVVKYFFIDISINWIFEFIHFLADWLLNRDIAKVTFICSLIVNLIQGPLIFIVFVCRPSVLNMVKAKW